MHLKDVTLVLRWGREIHLLSW